MADNIKLSVIIPTFQRPNNLAKCLESLNNQTLNKSFWEVIVVNDGSHRQYKKKYNKIVKFFSQKHQGPAAARNLGIKKSQSKLLLFLGDDILASPQLLEKHLKFHQKNKQENFCLLGKVDWSKNIKKTPFIQWLDLSGMQADYVNLKNGQQVNFKHFYTTNISLKKSFMEKNGLFDSKFNWPAFEDTELGYRLSKRNLQIVFDKTALAFHDHQITLSGFCQKMKQAGYAGWFLYQKHPELVGKIFPTKLPIQELLRLRLWQIVYPLGIVLTNKKILFHNYQRIVTQTLIASYNQSRVKNQTS